MSDSSENEQELGTTNDSIVTSNSNSISEHELSDIDSDDEKEWVKKRKIR